jgi:hypothetical protein
MPDGFNHNIQMQKQQLQMQKYMTANPDVDGGRDSHLEKVKPNPKTLLDLFMIDRLVKKRANGGNNTQE